MRTGNVRTAGPREVELKFQLPPGSRAVLEASGCFAGTPATRRQLRTTYFDTADGALKAAGLTLRVRHNDEARVQTVKSLPTGNGVASDRGEWEWPIRQDEPDTSLLAKVGPLASIVPVIEGRLRPMFVTAIDRTAHLLTLEGDTAVEVAFDAGTISADGASEDVAEMELELKGGPIGAFYRFAVDLHAEAPCWISSDSKAARGCRLRGGAVKTAVRALPPVLKGAMQATDGAHALVEAALGHIIANIGPTLRGDAEGLHQLRLAVRGARAGLALFEQPLERLAGPETADQFCAGLQRFGALLGTARDWDVFCLATVPAAMVALPQPGLQALREAADTDRLTAHARVAAALRGQDFSTLVLGLAAWANAGTVAGSDSRRERLWRVVPQLLDDAAAEVRHHGRHPGRLTAAQRHQLRKSLKRLTYAVEQLGRHYTRRAVKAYGARCEALQDVLGAANDAIVGHKLALQLVTDGRPALADAAGALAQWCDRRGRKTLHGLRPAVRKLFEAEAFWA